MTLRFPQLSSIRASFFGLAMYAATANAFAMDNSLRVYAGDADTCTISREGEREGIPAVLGMAIGSAIIKSSVSAIGRYLTNAAQSTSSPLMSAVGSSDLFRVTAQKNADPKVELNLECIVVVTGSFGKKPDPSLNSAYAKKFDPDGLFLKFTRDDVDSSLLRSLGLTELPNSYFEFKVEKHPTSDAMRLVPKVAYFRTANSSLNSQGSKSIELTFTIVKPSQTGSLDVRSLSTETGLVAQIPLVMNRMTPGRTSKGEPIPNFDTLWMTVPKPPTTEELGAIRARTGSFQGTATSIPANLFITYREVDQPELIFSILASIVSDNSSQLSSAGEEAMRKVIERAQK